MKKLLNSVLMALAVVLIAGTMNAAEPQTRQGSMSVFWGLNGLSDLSVDNSFLGFQYLFADRMGIWGELNLSMISDKQNKDADGVSTSNFGLSAGFIYYMFQKGPVALYISPQAGFGSLSVEDKDATSTHIDSETDIYVGISVGAEWWFTDNVSLCASTAFGFHSKATTMERGSTKTEASETHIGILSGQSANFIISFYF